MLTKKDIDAIDDIEAGRTEVDDTHLADAAESQPKDKAAEAHEAAMDDASKSHVARDFGEAIADILLPSSATHDGVDKK